MKRKLDIELKQSGKITKIISEIQRNRRNDQEINGPGRREKEGSYEGIKEEKKREMRNL